MAGDARGDGVGVDAQQLVPDGDAAKSQSLGLPEMGRGGEYGEIDA